MTNGLRFHMFHGYQPKTVSETVLIDLDYLIPEEISGPSMGMNGSGQESKKPEIMEKVKLVLEYKDLEIENLRKQLAEANKNNVFNLGDPSFQHQQHVAVAAHIN